jgi:predicted XRE-type DNA-binding protein
MKPRRNQFIARNARELAEILNFSPAETLTFELRSELEMRIVREIRHQKLTHEQVAKMAETSRSRITAIVNGGTMDISTDLLLRVLGSLGVRATISFSRAA